METTTVRHTEQDGTVVVESVVTPVVNSLQPVFDALVKAVADRIMDQLLQSDNFDARVRDIANDEADTVVDGYMCRNFDIWDYEDAIKEMNSIDESQVRDIIKGMSFTVDVD